MNKLEVLGFVLIALALALVLAISLVYTVPVGWDPYYHLEIARIWARGEVGMTSSFVMNSIGYPYPPLFHFILVLGVWLKNEFLYIRILQSFFYPLGLGLSMWLMRKHVDPKSALFCGILLMSSIAYFDRLFEAIPQALDMILYPVVMHFFLTKRKIPFIIVCTLMIYNHSVAAILLLSGLFVLTVTEKRNDSFWIGTLSLPILIPSAIFLPQAWLFWGQDPINTQQELAFWRNPGFFSAWYLGALFPSLFLALYYALNKLQQKLEPFSPPRKLSLDRFDKANLLTIASLIPMIIPWPDRFLCYVTMPLAYLTARHLTQRSSSRTRRAVTPLIIVAFIVFQSILWMWLITRNYYIPPEYR